MGYTADNAEGHNSYLMGLLCPLSDDRPHIPDLELVQRVPKRVNYNTTISSNLPSLASTYNTSGLTGDLLFHFTPQSRFSVISVYVNVGSTALPAWRWVAAVAPDQLLNDNYSLSRYVNGYLEVVCSTISAGSFALSGQMWGVSYQDPPYFFNMSAQGLLAGRKDEVSYLENTSIVTGVVAVGEPTLDFRFTPSDTRTLVDGGTMFKTVYSNATSTIPGDPRPDRNTGVIGAGFWPANGGAEPATWAPANSTVFFAAANIGALNQTVYFPPPPNAQCYNVFSNPGTVSYSLPNVMRGDTIIETSVDLNAISSAPNKSIECTLTCCMQTYDGVYTTQARKYVVATGSSSGVVAMPIRSTFSFTTVAPIAAISIVFYAADASLGTFTIYTKTGLSVDISSPDVYRPGEVSNGSFVVATGLPTPAAGSTPVVFSVNGLVNYEGVPNANLAQNVRTSLPLLDMVEDLEAAKHVLANKPAFGLRSIYDAVDYRTRMNSNYFKASAERARIRETGLAFSLRGFWKGFKPILRGAIHGVAPAVATMYPQYGTLITGAGRLAEQALSAPYSRGTGLAAPAAIEMRDLRGINSISGSEESSSTGGMMMHGRTVAETASYEHKESIEDDADMEVTTLVRSSRTVGFCMTPQEEAFMAMLSEDQRAAYAAMIASRAGPGQQQPRRYAGGQLYADDDKDWITLVGPAAQRKVAELRWSARANRKPTPEAPFTSQRFPIVLASDRGAVVKFIMTSKPFRFVPDLLEPRTEECDYATVITGLTNKLNVGFDIHQIPTPADRDALAATLKYVNLEGTVYLTVNRVKLTLSGDSFCMAAYALLAGFPDIAPMSGGALRSAADSGPAQNLVCFTPIGKQLPKLQAAMDEEAVEGVSKIPHLICAGGELPDGNETMPAAMVAQATDPFERHLIAVFTPSDLAYLCSFRDTLISQKKKAAAISGETEVSHKPEPETVAMTVDYPAALESQMGQLITTLADYASGNPNRRAALMTVVTNARHTLDKMKVHAGGKVSAKMISKWKNQVDALKKTIQANSPKQPGAAAANAPVTNPRKRKAEEDNARRVAARRQLEQGGDDMEEEKETDAFD